MFHKASNGDATTDLILLMNQKSTIENPWEIPERSHGELAFRVEIATEQLYCAKAVQIVCGCHMFQ